MSIYKEIYDEVKNLDKDGILSYLENKDEESSKFKIRTSIDGKMTECSIEYLEGLKTIDDNRKHHCIEQLSTIINTITANNSYGSQIEEFYKSDDK